MIQKYLHILYYIHLHGIHFRMAEDVQSVGYVRPHLSRKTVADLRNGVSLTL